jgi:hypothetical protein
MTQDPFALDDRDAITVVSYAAKLLALGPSAELDACRYLGGYQSSKLC